LPEALDVLAELCSRVDPPGVLLERDDDYSPDAEIAAEQEAANAVGLTGDVVTVITKVLGVLGGDECVRYENPESYP
jgi:hypothetical protein